VEKEVGWEVAYVCLCVGPGAGAELLVGWISQASLGETAKVLWPELQYPRVWGAGGPPRSRILPTLYCLVEGNGLRTELCARATRLLDGPADTARAGTQSSGQRPLWKHHGRGGNSSMVWCVKVPGIWRILGFCRGVGKIGKPVYRTGQIRNNRTWSWEGRSGLGSWRIVGRRSDIPMHIPQKSSEALQLRVHCWKRLTLSEIDREDPR